MVNISIKHLLRVSSLMVLMLCCVVHAEENGTTDVLTEVMPQDQDAMTTEVLQQSHDATTTAEIGTTVTTPSSVTVPPTANPDDDPKVGHWNVTDQNVTCILFDASIRLKFAYQTNDNKTATISYDVPQNATATGKCSADNSTNIQQITLTFFKDWQLSISFYKTKNTYNATDVLLSFTVGNHFPNATQTGMTVISTNYTVDLFRPDSSNGMAYKCQSIASVKGFVGGTQTNLTHMDTWNMQAQAFRSAKDPKGFSDAQYCTSDTKVSSLVPIIVGAALAGLVLIVLIAYLIGRTRNKRGYESV